MKLSVTTFNIVKDWDLPFLLKKCRELGICGVEFRLNRNHAHGVELGLSKEKRREIREQVEDAYLTVVGVGADSRFDKADEAELKVQVEDAKASIELCADLGGKYVRVYGNDINPALGREKAIRQVGACLAEVIPYGRRYGVEALIEMHGDFNYWGFVNRALDASGVPDAGLIYNSDPRDVVCGSIAQVYSLIKNRIKLVHLHDFTGGFPYMELLQLLKDDGYDGYVSAELAASDDGEKVLAYFAETYRLMLKNLK